MLKVNSKKEAWKLADLLFPTDYEKDEKRSQTAGYSIYYTTDSEINAWISDLGCALELNYPNGSSENIWIEEKPDIVAFVGMYHDKKVFGDVTVKEVREVVYHNVQGFVNKVSDDRKFGIEIILSNDVVSFDCENVAYVRFDSIE